MFTGHTPYSGNSSHCHVFCVEGQCNLGLKQSRILWCLDDNFPRWSWSQRKKGVLPDPVCTHKEELAVHVEAAGSLGWSLVVDKSVVVSPSSAWNILLINKRTSFLRSNIQQRATVVFILFLKFLKREAARIKKAKLCSMQNTHWGIPFNNPIL